MRAISGFYWLTNWRGLAEQIKIASGQIGVEILYPVNKFGDNQDVGVSEEDVWTFGGTQTDLTSGAEHFISSSNASDTNVEVTVEGISNTWVLQTAVITFTSGQSQQTLGAGLSWIRINRAWVSGSTPSVGDLYIAESDTLTLGVPDTAAKVRGKLTIINQQTELARYAIPVGYTGFLFDHAVSSGYTSTVKTANTLAKIREFGGVFRKMWGANTTGNTVPKNYLFPLVILEKSEIKYTAISDIAGAKVEVNFTLLVIKSSYV